MLHVEEIRNPDGPIPSLFTGLEVAPVRVPAKARSVAPVASREPFELNLSVVQVLLWFTSAFSAAGLLLWAFLKLWLFEQ